MFNHGQDYEQSLHLKPNDSVIADVSQVRIQSNGDSSQTHSDRPHIRLTSNPLG
jgi:hypothetical protein